MGGAGAFVLSQQRPPAAATLPRVVTSQDAVRTFDEKMGTIEGAMSEAKRTGKAVPIEVTFTEAELTSQLAGATHLSGGLVATDTQVHLSGGNIVATSTVTLQGVRVDLGIVAVPVVVDGRTKIVITDVQAGAVPIPDALKREIASRVAVALDPAELGLGIQISTLRIVDGTLVLSGVARP